ncbi:MAG: hypothetical protein KDD47_12085 [Acidobacteria bacterium]|nr:hypothetical protein [Acidobacteriota bacterium]
MSKKIALVLALALLAGFAGTLVADEAGSTPASEPVLSPAPQGDALLASDLFTSPVEEALKKVSTNLDECFQCYRDCRSFPEPTRSQCIAWCYNTIPSCHL